MSLQPWPLGAEIHGREPVLRWEPLGDREGVRVHTTRAVYEADSLVITAGAWNDQMLQFLNGLATPERQVLAWFQPERPELFRPDNFPVFNLLVDEGRFYGFPVHGIPGFKIGLYHHFNETGRPDQIDHRHLLGRRRGVARMHLQVFPPGVRTDHDAWPPACSPMRRTATSSSTCTPISRRSRMRRPAPDTATSSPASSARSWPTWPSTNAPATTSNPFTANRFGSAFPFGVGGELSNVTHHARRRPRIDHEYVAGPLRPRRLTPIDRPRSPRDWLPATPMHHGTQSAGPRFGQLRYGRRFEQRTYSDRPSEQRIIEQNADDPVVLVAVHL